MTHEGRKTAKLFVGLEELEERLNNEILPLLANLGFEQTAVFKILETAEKGISNFLDEREVVQVENSLIEMVKGQSQNPNQNNN